MIDGLMINLRRRLKRFIKHNDRNADHSTVVAAQSAAHLRTPIAPTAKSPFIRPSVKLLSLAILTSTAGIALAPTVHAGVFDPLLKIILPFYQPDKVASGADASQTNAGAQQANNTADASISDTLPTADINKDDMPAAPSAVLHNALNNLDIPAIFLDDTLVADHSDMPLDTPDLYALLDAEFAADRDDVARALSLYKAESFKNNAVNVFERALALSIEYEKPSESLAFATAWQNSHPEHIPAWFYVTHLALKAGEYRQAAAMLSTILHYDPHSDLAQILSGIAPSNHADQQALFLALQALGQDNASVSVLRAGLLRNLGEPSVALLHVNHALTLEPNNLAFITLKLDIMKSLGQTDALWAYLHKTRKALPQEKELYLYEIRHMIEAGELDAAWQLLTVASKNTNHPDVILLAGLVGLDTARYNEAINILSPLLNNTEFQHRAHYYTGIGYERLGDTVRARKHFERVNTPDLVLDARTKVVGFYLLENNSEAAINALVWLRDEYESFATDSYILQAEIYLRQGDKNKARDLLTIANREYPNDDRLLYASYTLLADELSDDDKQDTAARLMELDSFNPAYQLLDAKLRLAKDPNNQGALSTITDISQISIDDPNYDSQLQLDALMALANHALSQGEFNQVIELLQTAYDVQPTRDAGILLLRAHQGLGDTDAVNSLIADLQTRFLAGEAADIPTEIAPNN